MIESRDLGLKHLVEMRTRVLCLEVVLLVGGPSQSRSIPASTLEKNRIYIYIYSKANCSQEAVIGCSKDFTSTVADLLV